MKEIILILIVLLSLGEYLGVLDLQICNSHKPRCRCIGCWPLRKRTEMVYSIILSLMILTLLSIYCLFYCVGWLARHTHVNVLYCIVRLYYFGICLVLVIQTFYQSSLSVLYNKKMSIQLVLLYDTLRSLLLYLNHIMLSYHFHIYAF